MRLTSLERAQVVLYGIELPDRDAGEGCVLAVGAEEPLVVRETRSQETHPGEVSLWRRVVLARVGLPDLQVPGDLHGVCEVLLAPVYAVHDPLVTGQRESGVLPEREPAGDLRPQARLPGPSSTSSCSASAASFASAGSSPSKSAPATANHTVFVVFAGMLTS